MTRLRFSPGCCCSAPLRCGSAYGYEPIAFTDPTSHDASVSNLLGSSVDTRDLRLYYLYFLTAGSDQNGLHGLYKYGQQICPHPGVTNHSVSYLSDSSPSDSMFSSFDDYDASLISGILSEEGPWYPLNTSHKLVAAESRNCGGLSVPKRSTAFSLYYCLVKKITFNITGFQQVDGAGNSAKILGNVLLEFHRQIDFGPILGSGQLFYLNPYFIGRYSVRQLLGSYETDFLSRPASVYGGNTFQFLMNYDLESSWGTPLSRDPNQYSYDASRPSVYFGGGDIIYGPLSSSDLTLATDTVFNKSGTIPFEIEIKRFVGSSGGTSSYYSSTIASSIYADFLSLNGLTFNVPACYEIVLNHHYSSYYNGWDYWYARDSESLSVPSAIDIDICFGLEGIFFDL